MKKHWLILIGILFGVFDFYYQEMIQGLPVSNIVRLAVIFGIWLVPAIPVVLYEAKATRSPFKSALANVLTWSVAILSYYLYLAVKLIFIGQSTRPELYFANYQDAYYWSNLQSLFFGDVLYGIGEWIGVALLGGFLTGYLIGLIYLHIGKPVDKQSL